MITTLYYTEFRHDRSSERNASIVRMINVWARFENNDPTDYIPLSLTRFVSPTCTHTGRRSTCLNSKNAASRPSSSREIVDACTSDNRVLRRERACEQILRKAIRDGVRILLDLKVECASLTEDEVEGSSIYT